ncbi:MAG TPA: cytochrome P450 [Pseudomonadales bacterium]|nr:cytochrome P450 [Pseudomonadales bacterium]
MSSPHAAIDFDPTTEAFARDPYVVYAGLRAQGAPQYFAGADAWLLSAYADVDAAARDPRLVRSTAAFMSAEEIDAARRRANWHDMPNHQRFVQVNLLETDGPEHHRLRMLVLRNFTRSYVERHRAMIQRYVDALLDDLLERGSFDFVADLAAHVPGHIIGNVLGVPDADCPQLRVWSEQVVQFFDVGRTAAHKQLAERATGEFHLYLRDLIAERRLRPQDDLLSTLIREQDAGALDETELVATAMLILMAGHGSTIDVLGTGMQALLAHPQQTRVLRDAPAHMATAVQEMFRYESPLPFFHRYAREELTLFGRSWPVGTRFGLLYGAANRDPEAFTDADRFDVTRTPNRHVAFGRGAHLCLGNQLARLDMEIIFATLLRRTRAIEGGTEAPRFKRGLSVRGLEALPVTVTRA